MKFVLLFLMTFVFSSLVKAQDFGENELKEMLFSTGYHADVIPTLPMKAKMQLSLRNVESLDIHGGHATINVYMRLFWEDP